MLFDKDQDGVLSFGELCLVMNTLGIRISGWKNINYNHDQLLRLLQTPNC